MGQFFYFAKSNETLLVHKTIERELICNYHTKLDAKIHKLLTLMKKPHLISQNGRMTKTFCRNYFDLG